MVRESEEDRWYYNFETLMTCCGSLLNTSIQMYTPIECPTFKKDTTHHIQILDIFLVKKAIPEIETR